MNNSGHQTFKLINLRNLAPLQKQQVLNLLNLDTNTAVHNGATVDGSYTQMGNVEVMDGGVQMMSDVGKNRVDIDKMTSNAGSTTVFMAPGLVNLDTNTAVHNGATVDGSYF